MTGVFSVVFTCDFARIEKGESPFKNIYHLPDAFVHSLSYLMHTQESSRC